MNYTIIIDLKRTIYDPDKDKLCNNAIEFLQELKKQNFKIILIGKAKGNMNKKINELGIKKFFEHILLCKNKNLNDFKIFTKRLKINPKKCISIGDRIKKEIFYSNQLGFQTIWIKNGKFKNELPQNKLETPDYIANNLKEASKIIKQIIQTID